ncbi:MAG TPA: hypothetical protein PKL83_00475 [bacterium]|nr:hypothetical protein [bacterium]
MKKNKRALSLLVCLTMLFLVIPTLGIYAVPAAELYDFNVLGSDRQLLTLEVAQDLEFKVIDPTADETIIEPVIEGELYSFSTELVVGNTYQLVVSHPDYYTTNEELTVTETDGMNIFLYSVDEIQADVEAEVTTTNGAFGGLTGVRVGIESVELEDCDLFTAVPLPDAEYDVQDDGLPAGLGSAPLFGLDAIRSIDLGAGEYALFVGFFESVVGEFNYDKLIGYKVVNFTVTEPSDDPPPGPGEPGPGEPGPGEPGEERTINFRYINGATDEEMEVPYSFQLGQPQPNIEFPDWASGQIVIDDPNTGIGVWSENMETILESTDEDADGNNETVIFTQKFGQVVLHIFMDLDQYQVFESPSVMLTFVQPSYVGVDLTPSIIANGDTRQLNLNLPSPQLDCFFATKYVLVALPEMHGQIESIASITSAHPIQVTPLVAGENYKVVLPGIARPNTPISINFTMQDSTTLTKSFDINRLAITVTSYHADQPTNAIGFIDDQNPEMSVGVIDWGDEAGQPLAMRTYVTYEEHDEYPIEDPHLLVMYYKKADGRKMLMGTRQFSVDDADPSRVIPFPSEEDDVWDVKDILIYSTADDNGSLEGANMVSVFLISGALTPDAMQFNGVENGIGAGCETLMVNHPDHPGNDFWLNGGVQ